jgi:hypothetical protein
LDPFPPPSTSTSAFTSRASSSRIDYTPTDTDFADHVDADADPLPDFYYPDQDVRAPAGPPLPTYEATLKKPRRRRRTAATTAAAAAAAAVDLPPLLSTSALPDGETRFDWRLRALARERVPGQGEEKKWWFPLAWRKRVRPPMTKLGEGIGYYAELRRYAEQ